MMNYSDDYQNYQDDEDEMTENYDTADTNAVEVENVKPIIKMVGGRWQAIGPDGTVLVDGASMSEVINTELPEQHRTDFATNRESRDEVGGYNAGPVALRGLYLADDSDEVIGAGIVRRVESHARLLEGAGVDTSEAFPAGPEVEVNPALIQALESNPRQRAVFEENMKRGEIGSRAEAEAVAEKVNALIVENVEALIDRAYQNGYAAGEGAGYEQGRRDYDTSYYDEDEYGYDEEDEDSDYWDDEEEDYESYE